MKGPAPPALAMFLGVLLMSLPEAQAPGDRPAANPRSTRSVVMARRGMIATSQPLASAAGLQVLREGGNAVDAAVTAAAVLSVVEPTMNGPGGDLFALVYSPRRGALEGLNASGRAGRRATPAEFAARGLKAIPYRGPLSVTVPGVVDGWAELLARHGTIPLARALQPAIEYAASGFAVSEIISTQWQGVEALLAGDAAASRTFLVGGRAPRPGEVFSNPALAATLRLVAERGRDAFYRGPIAEAIAADMARRGGLLEAADFAQHRSNWVEPISTTYRGHQVFEMPPNTQGFVALEMLNLLEGFDVKALGHNSAALLHLMVEAKRIAFADRDAWLADPDRVPAERLRRLVSKEYAADRRREIDPARAAADYRAGAAGSGGDPSTGALSLDATGDTVYLTAADGSGLVVSLIQSIYESFGAGIVAGDTGVVLHNRGSLFSLEPGHPNLLAPGRRPLQTLVPAMVMKEGRPLLSFGVMGGDMQPQGHVQVLLNLLDFGMNVQEAGEAARFRHSGAGLALETAIGEATASALAAMGHTPVRSRGVFGGFQGILIDPRTGVLQGGSDPRKDGLAIGF